MTERPAPYLQEFETLDNILGRVPHKSQQGFLAKDTEWTCIDVTKEYLVIGTNTSIVCLYERSTGQVKKLNLKIKGISITKVKLINSVDYEVAVGTSNGYLFIYVLPSDIPGRNKTLQVFSISDMHIAAISCLEWSQNAMKLFSGDKVGRVVCTEIDYTESTSKSSVLCCESHEIVQLSYTAKTLLISSLFRTVVWTASCGENPVQVGSKPRKVLGPFGGIIKPSTEESKEEIIFASRPGLRLWQATLNGKVVATYIFKDLVSDQSKNVSLLADTTVGLPLHSLEHYQFGRLLTYQKSYLLSYHGTELYVIDPVIGAFSSYHINLGYINDVAVCDDEVFILRNVTVGRVLLRLAVIRTSNSMSHSLKSKSDISPVQVLSGTASKMSQSFIGLFKEVGEKIQSVAEGHRATNTTELPPWGLVSDQSDGAIKTAELITRKAGSPDGSVDSAHEASPSLFSSPAKTSPEASGAASELSPSQVDSVSKKNDADVSKGESVISSCKQESEPQDNGQVLHPEDPPPVVRLDGDQLIILKADYGSKRNEQRENGPQAETTNKVCSSPRDWFECNNVVISEEAEEELVYFQKTKKSRKKRIKPVSGSVKSLDSKQQQNNQETLPMPTLLSTSISSKDSTHCEYTSGSSKHSLDADSCLVSTDQSDNVIASAMLDIDLEKLKQDDDIIDVFDTLHYQPATQCTETVNKSHEISHLSESPNVKGVTQKPELIQPSHILPEDTNGPNPAESNHFQNVPSEEVIQPLGIPLADEEKPLQQHELKVVPHEELIPPSGTPPLHGTNVENDRDGLQPETSAKNNDIESSELEKEEIIEHTEASITSLKKTGQSLHLNLPLNTQTTSPEYCPSQTRSDLSQTLSTEILKQSNSNQSNISTSEGEDFYSLYNAQPFSPISPHSPQGMALSLGNPVTLSSTHVSQCTVAVSEGTLPKQAIAESWIVFTIPAKVSCISLSDRHVWFVDRKGHVFYSKLDGPRLTWQMLPDSANQIAVSPNGWIVWKVVKNAIYVATGISADHPAGNNWRQIARDVSCVSVDDHMAWLVKTSGEIGLHKSLYRDRPCHQYIPVSCPHEVMQVCCRHGIVWALTAERNIIVRLGVKSGKEEGTDWVFLQGEGPCQLVSSFALGDHQSAWILDLVGRVWFTTDVTTDKPTGSGYWWQVSMSEYLMQDSQASYLIKTLFDKPQNLSKLITADKGGIIAAGSQGIWLSSGHKNIFHVCRGSIMGYRWENCILTGLVPATKWLELSASACVGNEGLIWALQKSGLFFCFPTNYKHARVAEVPVPKSTLNESAVTAVSTSGEAVWVLMTNGDVYVRSEIGPHCVQGIHWARLSLAQIDDSHFVHLSCGSQTVWAVDETGMVYMRIGTQAPGTRHLNPAWVGVDGQPKDAYAKFIKVFVGTDDSMVWALDSKSCVYVRRGVTETMPLGNYWCYVSGTKAMTLCISNHTVYALNLDGEVLVRYGISEENVDGNYWKKIPGAFSKLSVTADDQLWAIDKDNLLYKCHLKYLKRHFTNEDLQTSNTDEGWELL